MATTSLYINSLVRYDKTSCEQDQPNPFNFIVPAEVTKNWKWKKTPYSANAYRENGGFDAKLDSLIIPASIMPVPEPTVMIYVKGNSNIDSGNMTRVTPNNLLCQQIIEGCGCGTTYTTVSCNGITCQDLVKICGAPIGCTGVTGAPTWGNRCIDNNTHSNLNNTWVAYYDKRLLGPTGEVLYYRYSSNNVVSTRDNPWFGSNLEVKVLNSMGSQMYPPGVDCDTPLCNYAWVFCPQNQVAMSFTYEFVATPSNITPRQFTNEK